MFENRNIETFTVWIAGVAFLLAAVAAPARAGQRVALVIGNAAYAHAPALATPLNDALEVDAALQRLGFAVTRVENADQAALLGSLRAFATVAETAKAAVVFYAGHGVAVDGRNFLLPVDARLSSERDMEFETVPLALVERAVERASGIRVIILDASRESPFVSSMRKAGAMRSIDLGLAPVEPSEGTLLASAAKAGKVVVQGQGRNSLYSEILLRHLEEPGLEVGSMFGRVTEEVLVATGGNQEPSVYGSLLDVSASLGPPPAATAEASAAIPEAEGGAGPDQLAAEKLAAERLYWDSVKDSDDPEELRTYLDRYPNGTYAALALVRVKRLKREAGLTSAGPASAPDASAPAGPGAETPAEPAESGPVLEPEAAEAALGLQRDDRRLIQSGLAALGFDPGPVDGLFGRGTRAAIGEWQASQGSPVTGYVDAAAARALAKAGVAAPPRSPDPRKTQVGLSQAVAATLSKALQAAGKIDGTFGRAQRFAEIGEVFADAGDMRRAMQSLDLAMTALEGAEINDYPVSLVLSPAVRAQAKVGDARWADQIMARVLAIPRRLEDEDDQADELAAIAKAQAEAGDAGGAARSIEQALAAAARIEAGTYRDWALKGIAGAQAETGDIQGALATTQRIEDEGKREWLLWPIARAQAESGDIREALRTAERIKKSESSRAYALSDIAEAQAEAGDARGAARSIELALATAARVEAGSNRNWVLYDIVHAQAETGDIQGALATAQRIEDDESLRDGALSTIARAQAKTGDIQGTLAITQQFKSQARALQYVVLAQAKAGDAGSATHSTQRALAATERVEDENDRDVLLHSLAYVLAVAGEFPEALATAQRITTDRIRAGSFTAIARIQVKGDTP